MPTPQSPAPGEKWVKPWGHRDWVGMSWVPALLDHRAGPAPASLGLWEMAQGVVTVRGWAPLTL